MVSHEQQCVRLSRPARGYGRCLDPLEGGGEWVTSGEIASFVSQTCSPEPARRSVAGASGERWLTSFPRITWNCRIGGELRDAGEAESCRISTSFACFPEWSLELIFTHGQPTRWRLTMTSGEESAP